jgi:hypothetical protein
MVSASDPYSLVDALLGKILGAPSSLYRDHYIRFDYRHEKKIECAADLRGIPPISWEDLVRVPYLKRVFTQENLFTKIVYRREKAALFGRALADLRKEPFGEVGFRPMILFERSHENTEKGLWCYERNILPAVREPNLEITALVARQYEADSFIGETAALERLLPILSTAYDLNRIKTVSVIDTRFDFERLKESLPSAEISFRLALPETGVLAVRSPSEEGVFASVPGVILEIEEGELLVTKLALCPTPLIRYRTGIMAEGLPSSFLIGSVS